MKKIVAILMVLALVAGAFAADVSAIVRLDGDLANYDGNDFKALEIGHAIQDWNPVLAVSVEGDNYGASTSLYVNGLVGTDYTVAADQWNIWFKPADVLKLSVGRINKKGNMETIDWWNCLVNWKDEWGYEAEFELDALSLGFGLHQGVEQYWLAGSDIKGLGAYMNYAIGDGGISAIFDANNTFDSIEFEAGYKGVFDNLSFFVDGAFYLNGGATGFGVDFDLAYTGDSFYFETYTQYKDEALLLWLYGTLDVDPVTLYAIFMDDDLLADSFGATAKLGVNGSVGEMGWDVCAKIGIGETVSFSVPVKFTVKF